MWSITSASAPSASAGAPARPLPATPICGIRASARVAGSRSVTATPSDQTTPARSSSSTRARPGASASPCRSSGGTESSASLTASSFSCTSTTVVRVLHPFTHDVVDFQPLATLYHQVVRQKASLLDMNAAVCSSASSADSITVVVWFPYTNVVLAADPGSDWEVLHSGLYVCCALPFQGRLYATLSCSSEIVQLYPPRREGLLENSVVIADAPHSAHLKLCDFYLVESGGRMLLAVRQPARYANGSEWNALDWSRRLVCRLYVVDLNSQPCKLKPVKSIGDRALFLSSDRCLSVSASDLPSLSSNSIYSTLPQYPIVVLSLGTGLSERLADSCQIHDRKERIRPSVRPFTIADHLITYCNPREWSKGLMFHEYHYIPQSFEELIKKIRAQKRELRIPHIAVHSR